MAVHEKTQDQVLAAAGFDGVLGKPRTPPDWSRKVRRMRHDPTLGFCRDLFLAPLLSSDWTVISDAPKYKSAERDIIDNFVPKRHAFMRNSLRGVFDFGWQPFETVWNYNGVTHLMELIKLKPLLQDISEILVNEYGEFRGVRNRPVYLSTLRMIEFSKTGPWTDLNRERSMIVFRDAEGTNWYGDALMLRSEGPYDSWGECEAAAKRFDTKIAGAHWVIHFPPGHSQYNGQEQVSNYEIATKILEKLRSSGSIVVPNKIAQQLNDMNSMHDVSDAKLAWKIELITVAGTSENSFVGRQRYLDSLKARSVGFPERAIQEGQYGTKADAEAHADFAIDNIQMTQTDIVDQLNEAKVNFLLEVNHGREFVGHVRIAAAPLSDEKKAQMRALYMAYFASPQGAAEEADRVDWDAVRDETGVPTRQDDSTEPGATQDGLQSISAPADPNQPFDPSKPAAGLGEFTNLGQRTFTNVQKRITKILGDITEGNISRVLAEQMLAANGVPPERSEALLDDAMTGRVEPEETTAPLVV